MPAVLTRPTKKPVVAARQPRAALEITHIDSGRDFSNRVDETACVIKGVKIVGVQSNNLARTIGYSYNDVGEASNKPYSYAMECLKRSIPLYEGSSVYQNHQPFTYDPKSGQRHIGVAERKNTDLLGWVKNVKALETGNPEVDGLYGDFHYIKAQAMAPVLIEVALRNPNKLALSHEAYIDDAKVVGGRLVITELKRVDGLALVNQEPGTTKGLFETHFQEPIMPTATIRQVIETSVGDEAQVKQAKLLLELMSGPPFDTVGDAPAPPEMAAATPAAPVSADQAIKAAFKTAMIACFDDPALDLMATIHKVDDLLNALESIVPQPMAPLGGALGGAPVVEDGGEEELPAELSEEGKEPTEEGAEEPAEGEEPGKKKPPFAKESAEVDRGPLIIECSGMLTAAGIMPTANVLESMAALPTTEKRTAYVQELRGLQAPASPKGPVVPVPRSTIPTPGVNPAKPVAESKVPEYKPGELSKAFRG